MYELIKGVVGSTAYGLSTPDSDVDMLGTFVYPTQDLLKLSSPQESIVKNNPDITMHELKKFLSLSAKNNPTVLELMWLDEYELMTYAGQKIIDIRQSFLSQNIRNTYGGYAKQQSERLKRRGDFGADLKKRQAKHGRHCFRLLLQGAHALQYGEIKIRLEDSEIDFCRSMGKYAATNIEVFSGWVDRYFEIFNKIDSKLPEKPDYDKINEVLLGIRREFYG